MANYSEPEENSYDPLNEDPINEKKYTQASTQGFTPQQLNTPIAEPTFTAPPKAAPEPAKGAEGSGGFSRPKPQPVEPVNQAMNDLPKRDKSKASLHMATMVMTGYEFLHSLAGKGLLFGPKRMEQLAEAGVDMGAVIQHTPEGPLTVGMAIEEYNGQAGEAMVVTEEFKEEVMPVMQRVFEKRGIGMTDEQFLMYAFGKDMAYKGVIFMSTRATLKQLTTAIIENTAAVRSSQAPQPQQQYAQPTAAEPTSYNEVGEEDMLADDTPPEGYRYEDVPDGYKTATQLVDEMIDPQNTKSEVMLVKESAPPKKRAGRKSNKVKFK